MLRWLFEYCKRTSRWHAKQHEAWGCVGSRRRKERFLVSMILEQRKELRTPTGTATKNHWQSQHVLDTRTYPCGSDEKHDGNLLLNEFPSIILNIKSCLLSESNDHPSNEPLKLVNTKQAYSERTESNQENSVTPKVIRIFTFGILQYLLFKSQDFVYM